MTAYLPLKKMKNVQYSGEIIIKKKKNYFKLCKQSRLN